MFETIRRPKSEPHVVIKKRVIDYILLFFYGRLPLTE